MWIDLKLILPIVLFGIISFIVFWFIVFSFPRNDSNNTNNQSIDYNAYNLDTNKNTQIDDNNYIIYETLPNPNYGNDYKPGKMNPFAAYE